MNFNPPLGGDWILSKDSRYGIIFSKPTHKGKYHTIIARANHHYAGNIKTISELLQYAEAEQSTFIGTTRFKPLDLKSSIIKFNEKDCVRVDFIVEDHGVPDVPPGTFFILKGSNYYWLSSDNPNVIIESGYSQRYLPGDKPLEGIESEVEPFLKSITYNTPRGKETPLIKASKKGDLSSVEALLSKGVDINIKGDFSDWGKTALMEASEKGHIDIVRALIKGGADVNAQDILYGDTALMLACGHGYVNIVKLLLEASANVNIQNTTYGSTPLMIAVRNCYFEIANILLDAGADVNIKDNEGGTALTIASWVSGSIPIVKLLIESGADINARDTLGRTSLMWAAIGGHTSNRTAIN